MKKDVPNKVKVVGGVVHLTITRRSGETFLVLADVADLPAIKAHTWHLCVDHSSRGKRIYAVTFFYKNGKKFTIRMNRMILGETDPMKVVDHENHNTLDNRRFNLRSVIECVNQLNRAGPMSNNTSGYRGVYWGAHTGRWFARVRILKQNIFLGYHDTPEEAYAAVRKYHELHAKLGHLKPEDVEGHKKSTPESRTAQAKRAAAARWGHNFNPVNPEEVYQHLSLKDTAPGYQEAMKKLGV